MPAKTAVIGATGYLGAAFLSACREAHGDCAGTARAPAAGLVAFDLLDPRPLGLAAVGHREALICAGMTKIDACERERELSRRVNVDGTLELIRTLAAEGIKPVWFSSDYVFDGREGGYADDAPLSPGTEYGRQKRDVEEGIGEICGERHLTVRLGKVFSSDWRDDTLLNEMAATLAAGGEVPAAWDQVFCPTEIGDVVRVVRRLQAGGTTGVINVAAPEPWARYDLAVLLAGEMGVEAGRIRRISLDDLAGPVRRPRNTSLSTVRLSAEGTATFRPMSESVRRVARIWRST